MKDLVVDSLKRHFPDSILSVSEFRGELTIVVRPEGIVPVVRHLRDDDTLAFDSLRDICGVDYYRAEERFEVVYILFSTKNSFRLRLKVRVGEDHPHVPTLTEIHPGANWHERETFDMYGIRFDGHPDLRRIYLPEEFEHYPLRKEFPLMGIPGSLQLPRK